MSSPSSFLQSVALHGKMRTDTRRSGTSGVGRVCFGTMLLDWNDVTVDKAYFTHFYIVGVMNVLWCGGFVCIRSSVIRMREFVLWVMLLVHVSRRWYECSFVHVWRDGSKMHVAGYVVGIVHYLLLPYAFFDLGSCRRNDANTNFIGQVVCVVLFLFGQYQQYRHHNILARIRSGSTGVSCHQHAIPRTGWFEYVSCPHYLAEILIYLALVLYAKQSLDSYCPFNTQFFSEMKWFDIAQGFTQVKEEILFMWVVVNLSISSSNSHYWYKSKYDDYPSQRRALIPFVF